jgi:hypothetical protein
VRSWEVEHVLEYLIVVVLFLAAFIIPIWARMYLEYVQGLAALIFGIAMLVGWGSIVVLLPYFVLWVLGSLAALGKRSREEAEAAVEHHRLSYHERRSAITEEERHEEVLSYLRNKYGRPFEIVREFYYWNEGKMKYLVHPAGEPERTFHVRPLRDQVNGMLYTDDYSTDEESR